MFISHLHHLAIVNSLHTKILYLICLKFTTSTSCQTHSVHARSFLVTSTLAWVLCNVQRTKQLPLVNAKRAIPRSIFVVRLCPNVYNHIICYYTLVILDLMILLLIHQLDRVFLITFLAIIFYHCAQLYPIKLIRILF